MLALVDCNNFYASCERVFRPDLTSVPIVVLSNNDGCIIARSSESKELGFKMGDAFFKTTADLKRKGVAVFSSNYALYGDMSTRVMKTLDHFSPEVEIYSIDEAFVNLEGFTNLSGQAKEIKSTVERWTGIPVSVGIAPTKTLAKLANRIAKKRSGTFIIQSPDMDILEQTAVGDIWGIGRQLTKQLATMGIATARQLAEMNPKQARQRFSVVVERTVRELQGVSCIPFEEAPPHPYNIIVSRGFKGRVTSENKLIEAVSFYASRAAEKARLKKVYASVVTIWITTSPFTEGAKYKNQVTLTFDEARNDTPAIAKAAIAGLKRIYRSGYEYQKAGVMLTGLVYKEERQPSLFGVQQKEQNEKLMAVMDSLNKRFGRETLSIASSGSNRTWSMAREHLSPCYTTRWGDIPVL